MNLRANASICNIYQQNANLTIYSNEKKLSQVYLPNKKKIFCLKYLETKVLYQQVQEYLKYGIIVE